MPSDTSFIGDQRGVSAIVGVAIMVGLTVALAGLIGVVVFNIGGDVEDSAGATIEFDQSGDEVTMIVDDVDDGVQRLAFRGDAVTNTDGDPGESGPSGDEIPSGDLEVGATATYDGVAPDERIIVVAVSEDGTENRVGQYEVTDAAA